jgi:glycerol-3-phosphate dehydrogenase
MPENSFDVAIVGGGIHGVGVAQAVAAAGYSVVLLEKTGLASGTSGKSSKLIHGGLRYLETAQLSLVAECLRERALLLINAPGLVKLKKIFIPVYGGAARPPWMIRAGLSMYFALSGFNKESGFRSVPRKEWASLDGLATDGLRAVFQYHEAQTDDALLTKAVMDSAVELGAQLRMPADFSAATFEKGGWTVRFAEKGGVAEIRAGWLVNAAGPWANLVLEKISPKQAKVAVDLVQGSHIIVAGEMRNGIYYVEAADRRGVFLMPWQGKTMIGTTETVFTGDPAKVAPVESEIEYLLKTARRYFPRLGGVGRGNLAGSFAGIRVLPASDGNPFHRSRETVLHGENLRDNRLVSIFGGKLTSYRATGESVARKIEPFLPPTKAKADTKTLVLK